MSRARGARFQLLGKTATAGYGTTPTGAYGLLPCYSFELGKSQDQQDDPLLSVSATSRDASDPYQDLPDITGNAVVPLDVNNIGFWLHKLFGPAAVSGDGTYTHVWKSGAYASLPDAVFEKGFPEVPLFMQNSGVKANTLQITVEKGGAPARATIALLGKDEVETTASIGGTPTEAALQRFAAWQASGTLDGEPLSNVTQVSLSYSNGLEAVNVVDGATSLDGVDEGRSTLTGSFVTRLASTAFLNRAGADTPGALTITWPSGSSHLTITVPRLFLARPKVGVTGPDGVEVTYDWRAAIDPTLNALLQATLVNGVAAYV